MNKIVFCISVVLFMVPFLWLKPGEVDLGGDSSRLYFYDPYNYLINTTIYAVQPFGFRPEESYSMYLPFVLLLSVLKVFLSPYLLVTLFNGVKLSVAFLFTYFTLKEFLIMHQKREKWVYMAGIIGGLLYTFSPVMVRASWDKAIMSQNQYFLNPLMFFILLKFVNTGRTKYLLLFGLLTVIFSGNFSWGAAPPFFSFYPLIFLFLFIYHLIFQRARLKIRSIILVGLLTFIMHSFHVLPLIIQLFNRTGTAFGKGFTSEGINAGVGYFLSTALTVTTTKSWLFLPQLAPIAFSFSYLYIVFPLILSLGMFLSSKKGVHKNTKKVFLLLFLFFLITFFLVTANITEIGFTVYKNMFYYIPGFTMFRNYYGQWMFVYAFFSSLLVGFSLYFIFIAVNKKINFIIGALLIILITMSAAAFIRGDMINYILNPGIKNEHKVPLIVSSEYQNFLDKVRSLPDDSKILTLPFTETYYQMLSGTQGGVYQGPSTISYLANKADFVGYQTINPFSEMMLHLVKENEQKSFMQLLSIMNIGYIFYNSDPAILRDFPYFPYQHVQDFFPQTNAEYEKFISQLPVSLKFKIGDYALYEVSRNIFLPHIYVPTTLIPYNYRLNEWGQFTSSFINQNESGRIAYIDIKQMQKNDIDKDVKISFHRINTTKYYIKIEKADKPFYLVFSDKYSPNWKLFLKKDNVSFESTKTYFNGSINEGNMGNEWLNPEIFETIGTKEVPSRHMVVNGYANGWLIDPSEIPDDSFTIIMEMVSQRYIYIGMIASGISVCIGVIWFLVLLLNQNEKK